MFKRCLLLYAFKWWFTQLACIPHYNKQVQKNEAKPPSKPKTRKAAIFNKILQVLLLAALLSVVDDDDDVKWLILRRSSEHLIFQLETTNNEQTKQQRHEQM